MVGIAVAWIVGLVITTLVGHFVLVVFLDWLRGRSGLEKKTLRGVPAGITGITERIFFASLVAVDASGYSTAMMGWLALKLATNWNHPDRKGEDRRVWAFSALVAGLLSMLIAFFGGLFIRWLSGRLQ
ncbi:MAG: hypothetical protein A3F74_21120 [Betaproteobacteria bacterium RIFCSPLOWO2_12_FULL_62_58]|nr:MAG: hypothetical protein A3F74_21120 [Betaproteobacteria bacterium RIFCSPLOWO2_12_FULL_62_58]